MPQLPYFQGQLTQFPWGRLERDGTFSYKFLHARFGVLDADYRNSGFWAIPDRLNPHDVTDDPLNVQTSMRNNTSRDTNVQGYAHGQIMLAEEWPSDVEGWKLRETLIPHVFFTGEFPPPARPRPGQVKDWKSWYKWRGLSLESPAAVLMDCILTTFYLLTETLKVVDLRRQSGTKQIVDVHYLGAETELNYLPLYAISSPHACYSHFYLPSQGSLNSHYSYPTPTSISQCSLQQLTAFLGTLRSGSPVPSPRAMAQYGNTPRHAPPGVAPSQYPSITPRRDPR
jgi:hypothetical protein